ncbi:MAG: 2-dehydro-3-deoxygalactonokinase [Pseudodonghicola sp.]
MTDWIAVDLQPGLARGWSMRGDSVLDRAQLAAPHTPVPAATAAPLLAGLRAALPGDAARPLLICGLAVAPQAVPAKPSDLVPLPLPDAGALALPALSQVSPSGLMPGAAARIAGFFALNPRWDGVICLPGPLTHWVQVSAEEVVSFQSFLSGTLAAALAAAPLLHEALADQGWAEEDFAEALDTTLSRPERLAAGLAALQADHALGRLAAGTAPARLSGLLTGAELAAARPYWLGQQVAILGEPADTRPYAAALERQGVPCLHVDPARMALAGLTAAWRRHRAGA